MFPILNRERRRNLKPEFPTIENRRLIAIYKQSVYNRDIPPDIRFKRYMAHLEGLQRLKKLSKRVNNEKI
jgi:hypothetical protein